MSNEAYNYDKSATELKKSDQSASTPQLPPPRATGINIGPDGKASIIVSTVILFKESRC